MKPRDDCQPVLRATAPGRVNLIGDHTDYMGGLAMPMTVPMSTVIEARQLPGRILLHSDSQPEPLEMTLPVLDAASVTPKWGRYVAAVAQLLGAPLGVEGKITSDLPVGAGLSSSAALEVATALILGANGTTLELARLCQAAEHLASGVPSGLMDQMAIIGSEPGQGLLIDFTTLETESVPLPESFQFWVIDSNQRRKLENSDYASRRAECEKAQELIGPLPAADPALVESIEDPTLRARARHVMSECARVRDFADAMRAEDIAECGHLMLSSHESLRVDFEVSTADLDNRVDDLMSTPGVHGARLTGAGFGGCLVALAEPQVELDGWRVSPSGAARLEIL
ncbi:MAG: galactokinase family protein [Microthrixaceae bacterium]